MKSPKLTIKRVKYAGENTVEFGVDSQFFYLCLHDRTKKEADWYVKQLTIALTKLRDGINER